jgi:hypothetical protein
LQYGENSENDIWGGVDEIDEFTQVPENEQEEDAELEKAKQPEPSEFDKLAAELEDLADGKGTAQSKVVKGLQRVIARKDDEIRAERSRAEQLAQQYEARMAQIEEQLLVTAEGATLTWDMLNANLEDNPRREAELEAHRRNLKVQQSVAEQRAQRTQRQAPPPQQNQPDQNWEANLANQIALEQQEFLLQARATAQAFGVNPDNAALDYGAPTEKFNTRFAKLNASLAKAKEASAEESVKAVRGTPIATRGANAGEPISSANSGLSLLEIGSRQRLEMMRKASA